MSRLLATALLAIVPFASLPAHAQLSPFRAGGSGGFTSEDFRMQNNAARRLIGHTNPHDGASEKWQNPRSGASGTITILNSFERNGMTCRNVDFSATNRTRQGPQSIKVNWCLTPNGWKIVQP